MPVLLLSLSYALCAAGKLEVEEEPIEVKVTQITERPDVAVKEALEIVKKPASDAQLHQAARVCALLGIDVTLAIAAAKSGPADSLDARLLSLGDVYLGLGDWANAERALKATRPSPRVHERLGHALRAQNRFADASKAFVAAVESGDGRELDAIVARIAPVMGEWVLDYEAANLGAMRSAAKPVLTAMLPHQAGEGSETTKAWLARLEQPHDKSSRSTLTAARFKDALAVQLPALRACFARALVQEPNLKGRIELKLAVADGGKITSVTTATNTTNVKPLQACFEQRAKALNLATETPVEVTQVFVLNPL
ncbi:MAG: AgmX/PglI C-terminal domain-containing protein [Myxococcaceae bacterium]|nr:AgmX/PglI C-terminal domain-containing protein [Myxococcaceae bacterium]